MDDHLTTRNNDSKGDADTQPISSTQSTAPLFVDPPSDGSVGATMYNETTTTSKSPSFFAQHKTYFAFLLVATTIASGFVFISRPKIEDPMYTVASGSIKQYVKVNGQVKASSDANLSFQTSGAVAFVGVKTGDTVTHNKIIATLSASDAQASLLQAQAGLSSAQALLAQLRQGPRKEELAYKEQVVENTKNSLAESYTALPDVIKNVDATTADIVKNKFSALFTVNNGNYLLSFSSCDQRLQREIEVKREALEGILANFQSKSSLITSISSVPAIDTAFEQGYQAAIATNELVSLLSGLLLLPCSLTNPSLDAHRTTLSTTKTMMTALFSDITVKRSSLIISKNAYNQATKDLELTKAGTDPYKIQAQRAAVEQAQAQVSQAKANLEKTILKAPFAGVVSNVAITTGETVLAGKVAISMISSDGLEIEAKVPEVDIVKVKVGSAVDITLDAYGSGVMFRGVVSRINPTASIEGTVPVYKIIVSFVQKEERAKEGMTANLSIISEDKQNAIILPARYIRIISPTQGEVYVLANGVKAAKKVTLGIRGSSGEFEIKAGLLEGDEVLPLP